MSVRKMFRSFNLIVIVCCSVYFKSSFAARGHESLDEPPGKPRVAVIGGGGAGVTTAWLLDSDYDVTLYEKLDRLGGDADTVQIQLNGKTYPIDEGFEFINRQGFPKFFRLLQILKVKLKSFQLTTTFTSAPDHRGFVITPVRDSGIAWKSILTPRNLMDLLRLKKFFDRARNFVEIDQENRSDQDKITLQEYLDQTDVNPSFRDQFLLPLLSSGWGVTREEMLSWSTENILRTVLTETDGVSAPQWTEIEGGTAQYIRAAREQLNHTEVVLSAEITSITYDEARQGYWVSTTDRASFYDYLVIATPAHQVHDLLKNIEQPEIVAVSSALNQVEYYDSHVAIHGDPSFVPQEKKLWSVVNIRTNQDGTQSGMTMYKSWHSPAGFPIFKSWILKGDPIPNPLYADVHYRHRKLNFGYLNAKKAVIEFQGKHHLWFAGAHTLGDRHENAILSALFVAKQLAPNGERVRQLESQ